MKILVCSILLLTCQQSAFLIYTSEKYTMLITQCKLGLVYIICLLSMKAVLISWHADKNDVLIE